MNQRHMDANYVARNAFRLDKTVHKRKVRYQKRNVMSTILSQKILNDGCYWWAKMFELCG